MNNNMYCLQKWIEKFPLAPKDSELIIGVYT